MYFTIGGCSTLFHLMVRNPILVLALGFAGLANWLQVPPHPGDANGTASYLAVGQAGMLRAHPELVTDLAAAAQDFALSRFEDTVTEEQAKYVLGFTDACTDVRVQDIMNNPERRKEAAWLFYLDYRARMKAPHQQQIIPSRK